MMSLSDRILKYASALWIVAISIFLIVPLIVVMAASVSDTFYLAFPPKGLTFKWYENLLGDAEWLTALTNSLIVAAISTVIVLIIGVPAAVQLNRRDFKPANVLTMVFMAPILVPSLMYVLGTMLAYAEASITPPLWALSLALSVLTAPYMIRNIMAALDQLPASLEEAALNLGAKPIRVWIGVFVPNIAKSIVSSSVLCFVLAFDELLVPLFLANIRSTTLPVKIYETVAFDMDPSVAAVSTLLIIVSSIGVILMLTTSTTPIDRE